MIKSSTKKSFIVVLLLCLCLSLTAFSFTNLASKKATATQQAWQTEGVFAMEDGVALKLSNAGGLRFRVKMDESVKSFLDSNADAELGFIFAPEELMLAANGDYLGMSKKVCGAVDKGKIYKEGDYYFANGCITNIGENNREFDFVSIAYIKVGETVRYTPYNDYARNSFYDTVNLSVVNGYGEDVFAYNGYSDWYGSNVFPIVVDTDAEYDTVADLINNSTHDLTEKIVIVEDGATTSEDIDESKAPAIMSRELFEVSEAISVLPDSVTMPDGIGKIREIRRVEGLYNALSQSDKDALADDKYSKYSGLLSAIDGYNIVYKNDATDGTVIPSHVPNYTSAVGGTAASREDGLYGNVLTVTSDASGKAALHYTNFPSVGKYSKIYFYVKTSVSCDLYLSDGITNDGWGENWKNTWSVSGFWCNANTWRLVEIDVSSGYVGTNFALGFRTETTGFTFEISDIYGKLTGAVATGLTFGNFTDSGTTNENGKVYNFTQGWSSANDMGAFNAGALKGALLSGYDCLYFYIYNPQDTAVDFMFTGDMNSWNATGEHLTNLSAKTWTKVVVTPTIIQQGDSGTWFVSVSSGANVSGWQISAIFADSYGGNAFTDHGDVKEVINLINSLPASVTLSNEDLVKSIRQAYDKLAYDQQSQVTNYTTLQSAEQRIVDYKKANDVIAMINAINSIADESLVTGARNAYNALTNAQKELVTNLDKLVDFENQIANENNIQAQADNVIGLINNLPDSVVMPDHLVFVTRIEKARDAYNALSEDAKTRVTNYGKLRTLVNAIKGYETAQIVSPETVTVVPSHVPNYTSTVGGTAVIGYDAYYGDYLRVTPNSGGKVAIQFNSFPDAEQYTKIYFNIRVVGDSCDIYLSDGITNDGWGENWKNTWSMSGFWTNNGNWIQKEVDVSTGIFSYNWALGLRTNTADVYFEITNIVGVKPDLGEVTGAIFGNFTDSGTVNAYGTVYNFTQGWTSDTDLGAFNPGVLISSLNEGHDSLRFYIYNPNESAVDFYVNQDETWTQTTLATLTAKAWTEVIIPSDIIEISEDYVYYMCVTSGASTSGWQISPIYSFSSSDVVGKVQARIDALDSNNPNSTAIEFARDMYEELTVNEKALVDVTNLVACEALIYESNSSFEFVTGSESKFKIYAENSYKAVAEFVKTHIENATGATLEIVYTKPGQITDYCYAIVIGYQDLFEGKYGALSGYNLGRAGYAVKSTGRAVFICANSVDGCRMGALAFLGEVVGYDMLSDDCIVYAKDGSVVTKGLNIVGRPFDYRQQQTKMSESEVYGMGLQSHTDLWIASEQGWDMHNSLHYLPESAYRSAHPSWYYDYTDSDGTARTQICPTAGGSSAEFDAMTTQIANAMVARINAYPTIENISFSIMDTADNDDCSCTRCKLYDTLYGEGGFAAAWIDLMNAVNAKVREQISSNRVINIAFLAYRGTEKAPASIDGSGNVTLMKRYEINDNGTYTQTSEYLKCDEGVTVWLAPINGLYAENLNYSGNATTLATVKKWCALSDSVFLWLYGTNFKYYMYPYNTWQASAENYKILYDLGVKGVWSQSNETEATAFSDLKSYIDSKFMANVNADYETVLDEYFARYFGPAGDKMREMFDYIVNRCNAIESEKGVGYGIYDELEYTKGWLVKTTYSYWTEDELNSLVTKCNEAKALVNSSSLTDAEKTAIINRITKESLFPRYVLCSVYKNSGDRAQFAADCRALGFTLYREADGDLEELFKDWNV